MTTQDMWANWANIVHHGIIYQCIMIASASYQPCAVTEAEDSVMIASASYQPCAVTQAQDSIMIASASYQPCAVTEAQETCNDSISIISALCCNGGSANLLWQCTLRKEEP